MNSQLLAVIASERERRNAPAVRALKRISEGGARAVGRNSRFWERLRNHVGEVSRAARLAVAFRGYTGKEIVLPGSGHKMDEVREELIEAGILSNEIENIQFKKYRDLAVRDYLLLIYWLLVAAGHRVAIASRLSARTQGYINVIFQYSCLRVQLRIFSGKPYWCVIGDLSPFLIALAGAVRAEGHRLMSWQYGYQDFKRFPAGPDLAVVLNRKGMELARVGRASRDILVFQRQTIDPVAIRLPVERHGVVGVVLNAFSMPNVLNEVVQIQKHLRCRLIVRPHPRDRNMSGKRLPYEIEICSSGALEALCSRVDWVICGNTTSALKIVGNGFPVCQYFGFDLFFDDHFEYGKMGLIPTFKTVDSISEEAVMRFFAKDYSLQSLRQIFGQTDMSSVMPLTELRNYLQGPGTSGFV